MPSEEGTGKYGPMMLAARRLRSFGFAPHPSRTFDTSVTAVSQNAKQIPKSPQSKCKFISLEEYKFQASITKLQININYRNSKRLKTYFEIWIL